MTSAELRGAAIELFGADRGWQLEFSKAMHVDYSTARRWLSGETEVPGPVMVAIGLLLEQRHSANGLLNAGVISKISLDEGDILAVTFEDSISASTAEDIGARVRDALPGRKVLVFGDGAKLSVVGRAEAASHPTDCAGGCGGSGRILWSDGDYNEFDEPCSGCAETGDETCSRPPS